MVKKNQKWEWTERQERMFKKLKEKFTKELVLAAPDLDKKEDGSRHIRLCNGKSIIDRVQRWKMETSGISLEISK